MGILSSSSHAAKIDAAPDKIEGVLHMFARRILTVVSILLTFSHFSYARLYLGSIALAPLSLLHYLAVGGRQNLVPTPFFDPFFFKVQAGDIGFLRYMCDRNYWSVQPSTWFDPTTYEGFTYIHPLARYRIGARARNSSARFDRQFVRGAVCRDRVQKEWMLFQIAASGAHRLPMNGKDLFAAQCAYRASLDYRVLRASAVRDKKFLVFVQAGPGFRLRGIEAPHSFDLMLNYYDRPGDLAEVADIVTWQAGTKTTAIANVLKHDAELLLRYDAVLFLDDDLDIECSQIDRLFEIFQAEGLDLAQPSLTAESSCYFRCLKQPSAGGTTRKMNGVEIMMPLVSRRVLREFGWIFSEGVSGWGVDLLISAKVRERFGETIALIGEISVAHARPVDTVNGALYVALRRNGIDANSEAGDIVRRHALPQYAQRIRPVPEAHLIY